MLQGRLDGNEKEIQQMIQKRDLARQIAEAQGRSAPNAQDQAKASALVETRDRLKEQAEAADALKAKYEQLADSIAGELTGAFRSIIDGSKSAEEALADAFQGIADAFLDMAMQMIQEWIKMQLIGLVGSVLAVLLVVALLVVAVPQVRLEGSWAVLVGCSQRAVVHLSGAVSIVGERGPELFVPDQPGRIISNRDSKSAMARYTPANSIEELAMQGGGGRKSEWGYSSQDEYQPVINIQHRQHAAV